MESDLIVSPAVALSVSVQIKAIDSRCRHWAKMIRAGAPLPQPSAVDGATQVPGPYLRDGDEEMFVGDILIEGEANHHRRLDRGWSYFVSYVNAAGEKSVISRPGSAEKAAMKTAGMPAHLLAGSGEVAACIRVAHGIRLGLI